MLMMTEIASGLSFPEGPVAMADGSVIIVELTRGTLTRVLPDGATQVVAETGGGPNGAAIGPDGRVYVCNNGGVRLTADGQATGDAPDGYVGGYIQRVNLTNGETEVLYTGCNGHSLHGPNDLVFDASGGFWFTDMGKMLGNQVHRGAVYYAKADGSFIEEVIAPIDGPNGVALSPGDKHLYVSQTMEGRVWKWDLAGPGKIRDDGSMLAGPLGGKFLFGSSRYQMLDSMAVDNAGNVCVATLVNGGITVISPDGASSDWIPTGDPFTTNICFGGPDLRTAFITLSGSGKLVTMRWPRPGLKLRYNR